MTPPPRLSRPLQRRCSQCRRVQEVRLSALYHIVVPNKGGGTRRDGGYDCRYCGFENQIPVLEMPQGLVLALPGQAEQREAALAAKAKAASPIAPKTPPPAARPLPPEPTPRPAPSAPVAEQAITPPSRPEWIVGRPALTLVRTGHARAEQDPQGFCTAFVRTSDGAISVVDARGRIDPATLLDWLDRESCELLIVGGSHGDGGHWKMIFHPLAGAASLADELA